LNLYCSFAIRLQHLPQGKRKKTKNKKLSVREANQRPSRDGALKAVGVNARHQGRDAKKRDFPSSEDADIPIMVSDT
jgi:hypothetical protein